MREARVCNCGHIDIKHKISDSSCKMSGCKCTVMTWDGKTYEEQPPKPEYTLCNQGHELVLMRNERDELTWDCPTCIERMRKDREEVTP